MAQASRPLLVVVALAFVIVAGYLLIGRPQADPPERSHTPFAPVQSIQQAQDAAAISAEANRRLEQAAEQAGAP